MASVGASVGESVGANVRVSVRESVRASVWASVGASVRESVRASVRESVWESVWASVWASVRESVWASVRESVWASVGASVEASVWAAGYGQHDAAWIGFYDALREFGVPDLVEKLDGLTELTESAGWYWPFKGLCILTERHDQLHRDERGRLHATDRAAVHYPDGWSIFAWHGVRVSEAIILHPELLTAAQIRDEENSEIRRVMLERFGHDRFIHDIGAVPVNTDRVGTLYRVELPNDEPLVMVHVLNSTPEIGEAQGLIQAPDGSWRKRYWLRVPPTIKNGARGDRVDIRSVSDQICAGVGIMRLCCLFGFHDDRHRERIHGELYLVCPRCGHCEPAITRTPEEAARIRSGSLCGTRQAEVLPKPSRKNVTSITKGRQAR